MLNSSAAIALEERATRADELETEGIAMAP
jgi:hypothetical protein